ncbi:hypothetical protein HJC23_010955 [Cyclotella cryptica]|uniref:Ankyrin n=1 Tax=Cyclotella cryptica TaxID=29204 RepID=A0ABD3Q8Y2_9STRA
MHISLRPHINFSRGRNKLNLFLFEEDWQSAITEIECHPHETKIWSARPGFFDGDHESNVLPIHVACSVHAPIEVIKAIVEAHPEGVQSIESAFKRLPIHVACQFAARDDVIDYLVEQYCAGTMEADILGRLPIHYACSNGAPLDVVRVLLRANKASTQYADLNGWVPLHVAIHFGAETEVIKEILNASSPNIVSIKTKRGSTALCLAKKVTSRNKEEVLDLLEQATDESDMADLFGLVKNETKSPVKSRYVPYAA